MAGAAKYKLGPGPSNTNWGLGPGPGNTNTIKKCHISVLQILTRGEHRTIFIKSCFNAVTKTCC